ncbi:zinc transport system substrate-binding protein [Nocardioides daedukensis]|uniref:Zinc transport system substrate-binding protein n=1 Tax=Nocardioides daedukensis TaxID=634462 RepID=A0A7Y9S1Q7_9ACTN|nr:metal ABC transporter substrate-binding protein [Nocardioides daedukensis]NYG60696.1 zinc transport system substrate-binding protein [Nocardioides daedukensis]
MNLPVTRYVVPALVSASLFLAGCGALSGDGGDVNQTRITTAFYPLEYAAERVAGSHFDVVNLTGPGTEPHDLELSVKQTGQVADARLVIFQKGFQPAVDKAVEQNANGDMLNASEVVELRGHSEEEDAGHEDEGHEDEGHDHDHGEDDPHFWLDPLKMADFSDEIAKSLAEIDPDHEADFTANAADFRTELEALDKEYADGLANCERTTVVVNHDAFGYLSRYGLKFESITGLSPGAEPTATERARLQELIREKGLTTVFSETLDSKKAAESLAGDLKINASVLDPIEGLGDSTSKENYLSLMTKNLESLKQANEC